MMQGEEFSDTNPHSPFTKIVLQILFWDSFHSKQGGDGVGTNVLLGFIWSGLYIQDTNNIPSKEVHVVVPLALAYRIHLCKLRSAYTTYCKYVFLPLFPLSRL